MAVGPLVAQQPAGVIAFRGAPMGDLARWFFEAIHTAWATNALVSARVQATLSAALADARTRWPAIVIADRNVVHHIAGCAQHSSDPVAALGYLHLADLYLARACLDRLPAAVAAFTADYRAPVVRALRRLTGASDLDQEVWQTLCAHLFVGTAEEGPRLATYRGRSPLKPFVLVCSQRLGLNQARSDRVRHRLADRLAREPATAERSPELTILRHRYRAAFERVLRDAVVELPKRDRTLLHLRFVGRLSTGRIGALLGISSATVSRRLSTVSADVWKGVAERLIAEFGLRTSEVESLSRAVASQIDIAMSVALRGDRVKKSRH